LAQLLARQNRGSFFSVKLSDKIAFGNNLRKIDMEKYMNMISPKKGYEYAIAKF
jgi:hypothetical protein